MEKSTIQGSVKNDSQQARRGITSDSTRHLQPKGWTARYKSRMLQQSPIAEPATLNDIPSSSQSQSNSSLLPTNNNSNLSLLPKRSHTEAFSPINDDDLYSPPNPSHNHPQVPTPISSSQPESPILQAAVISDNKYIPSAQPLPLDEPLRRSGRSRKPNSRFLD